ncbi:hypothetical protein LguiB_033936 [Lonicera macranthoides]
MPSLKMKTKSTTTGCLKEKKGLRVCQKSSTISKDSISHVRISHQAAEIEACTRNKQDISSCDKAYADKGGDEVNRNESLDGENLHFQKQLSPSTDFASVGKVETTPPTCTSNVETIFSPILESIDNQTELNGHNNGGIKSGLDLPPLGADDINDTRSSCEYRSCNVSDFYISDMIVSGLPIEGNYIYDDIIEPTSLPEYKCDETSMLFDEEYMILPFLEDTMEISNGHDRICEETVVDSVDSSSLYLAIHQLRSCDQESTVNSYPDWDQAESFDPHMFIRNLPDLSEVAPNLRPTVFSKEAWQMKSITLVLDLDETLVHSSLEHCNDADFTFPVFVNMKEHTVYVKKRPHLRTFLERVAEMFEIVVFTASQSIYAKQLLDILDPDGKLISHRAYRESCIFSEGIYTKDLTVLGVDLAKVAIIDNSPQVFRLQVNNGIPIKSWFDDPSDTALMSLLPFLETLAHAEDVRPIIAKRFGNEE